MHRIKVPVSIEGIEFDALISQEESFEATTPEYPTENGVSITDSILLEPEKLNLVLFVTDTPVTWLARHGHEAGRTEVIEKELKDLYFQRKPVTVITSSGVFENMAIESISFTKSQETGYAREIPISLKKISTASSKTVTIPDEYGKSGDTEDLSGDANTTEENTTEENASSLLNGVSVAMPPSTSLPVANAAISFGINFAAKYALSKVVFSSGPAAGAAAIEQKKNGNRGQ